MRVALGVVGPGRLTRVLGLKAISRENWQGEQTMSIFARTMFAIAVVWTGAALPVLADNVGQDSGSCALLPAGPAHQRSTKSCSVRRSTARTKGRWRRGAGPALTS
jgi:hypothetical protein